MVEKITEPSVRSDKWSILPSLSFAAAVCLILTGLLIKGIDCCTIAGCALLVANLLYITITSVLNRKQPLYIATPDGFDQPFHPSVIYRKNEFGGHKYWMAFSPYPLHAQPYTDRYEYPCIVASDDGIHWSYPGAMRPLDDLTEEQISRRDYYSDPHLCFDEDTEELVCYYRLTEHIEGNDHDSMYFRKTKDGITWSEKERIALDRQTEELRPLSPVIIKQGKAWVMWFVSKNTKPNYVFRVKSSNGHTWSKPVRCSLKNSGTVIPWHIDVQAIRGAYWMTVYDFENRVTLWKSDDGLSFSHFSTPITLPKMKEGSFYRNTLYRSCLLEDKSGYKLYFSCSNLEKTAVGLMEGTDLEKMRVVSGSKYSAKQLLKDWIRTYSLMERNSIHFLIKKIKGQ